MVPVPPRAAEPLLLVQGLPHPSSGSSAHLPRNLTRVFRGLWPSAAVCGERAHLVRLPMLFYPLSAFPGAPTALGVGPKPSRGHPARSAAPLTAHPAPPQTLLLLPASPPPQPEQTSVGRLPCPSDQPGGPLTPTPAPTTLRCCCGGWCCDPTGLSGQLTAPPLAPEPRPW